MHNTLNDGIAALQNEDGSAIVADISFICLGAFLMLFFTAVFEVTESNETPLPSLSLTSTKLMHSGMADPKAITLSVQNSNGKEALFLNSDPVMADELEHRLKAYGGLVSIHLRTDESLTVSAQNKILATCERAGVSSVSLVVKNQKETS